MTVKEGLQAALAELGPNGEKWAKGKPEDAGDGAGTVPDGFLCAVTSCGKITNEYDLFFDMRRVLEAQLPKAFIQVVEFNDAPETTFADVKALFERAIEATA